MKALPEGDEKEHVLKFVQSCAAPDGASFGGNVGHDSHLLYTLSAVQIFALFDRLDLIDKDAVARYMASLQQEDGSFIGDQYGEKDTRFSYIAIMGLSLLGRLDAIDLDKAVEFILRCKNFDEGFGVVPNAESHAGQTFCCVAALSIARRLGKSERTDETYPSHFLTSSFTRCD